MSERVQKIISGHGVASRREAENMILSGRVTVNGLAAELGQSADADRDEIAVDGIPLSPRGKPVYIALYKPRGYVTTVSDDRGRDTVMSLVSDVGERVYPVGRLDMYSEGLLIMTNDGQFANAVAHPSYGKTKSYEVRVRGDVNGAASLMRQPMEIDKHMIHAASVKVLQQTRDDGVLHISINEGRNRQIRKMCSLCSLTVISLKRVAIGSLELGALKPGQWRRLTERERTQLL